MIIKENTGFPFQGTPLILAEQGFVGDSIVDGPGLRCVLFCQGCPHLCKGCHNPSTHPFGDGVATDINEIYRRIKNHPLCRAVTFSGGEPFSQAAALAVLARQLKNEGYEIAAYTGYTLEYLLKSPDAAQRELLSLLDILIDGPFIEEQKNLTLRFRGSENQRILQVPNSLQAGQAVWETAERWCGKTQE